MTWMSNNSYTNTLLIEPKQSRQLFVVLLFSHMIAVFIILFSLKNHWFVQLIGLLLVAFSWFYYYRLHIAKVLSKSVRAAYHHHDKGWSISLASKAHHTQHEDIVVTLLGSSYVSQWWVILNFHHVVNNRNYTLLVLADSVSAELHRQLRVRLKIMD